MFLRKLLLNLPPLNLCHFSTPPFLGSFWKLFTPSNTFLTIPVFLQLEKDNRVLSSVYKWLKQKTTTLHFTSNYYIISFLYESYEQFQHLYIDPKSHLE